MKSKTLKIWGFISLLFLALVIAYLSVSIYKDISKNEEDASLSFTNLSIDTTNNAELNGFMTEKFIKTQKEMVLKTPSLKVILISGANGIEFAYPANSPLLEYSTGLPKIKTKSPLIKVKGAALPISGLRNCTITCLYDISNPQHIFRYSRNAFLAILSIILVSLLILISSKLSNNSSSIQSTDEKDSQKNNDFKFTSDLLKELDEFDYSKTADNFSNTNKEPTSTENTTNAYDPIEETNNFDTINDAENSYNIDSIDDIANYDPIEPPKAAMADSSFTSEKKESDTEKNNADDDLFDIEDIEKTTFNQATNTEPNEEDIDDIYAPLEAFDKLNTSDYKESLNEINDAGKNIDETNDNQENNLEDKPNYETSEIKSEETKTNNDAVINTEQSIPQGLFSPSTGLGWEQYLEDRLNSEISRAAQNEQDLALVIFRLKFLKRTDGLFRKIISKCIELFNFKDQIFEYGTDGIAIIVNNTTIDKIMQSCEELYKRIFDLFKENEYKNEIGIGISLRASRLISAERLITEAKNACAKAIMEPELPIVAFRADPERYRSFLTNQ